MKRSLVALCSALAACDAPAPASRAGPVETAPAAAAPTAAVTPPAGVVVPVEPPAPAVPAEPDAPPLAGLGPGGAEGREPRRRAALALLTDGSGAARLELVAADPGRSFDPELADELTPKIRVTTRSVPEVRQGTLAVRGPLDKEIVRRIVRAHINEVRYCYNQGLLDDPRLAGNVIVDFEILATGAVGVSALKSTTLPDKEVGHCIVTAIRRWRFPAPAQPVKVLYPFILAPAW